MKKIVKLLNKIFLDFFLTIFYFTFMGIGFIFLGVRSLFVKKSTNTFWIENKRTKSTIEDFISPY